MKLSLNNTRIPLPSSCQMPQKRSFTITWAIFCFFILFPPLSASAKTLAIDADTQFEYAHRLFTDGQYEAAATEFNRFIYFFQDDRQLDTAMFQVGLSFFKLNRFQEAQTAFIRVLEKAKDPQYIHRAYLMIAECRFKLNDVNGAVISLQQLVTIAGDAATKDRARCQLGWLMIETADWEKAKSAFNQLSPEGAEKYNSGKVLAALEAADTIEQKSPGVAGFLSILPGAGHLYCARPQDATIAFFLNAALTASAWQAFDRNMPWLGGLISAVELGVYSGTLYGAISGAHKYNRERVHTFIEKVKHQATPVLSFNPIPGGFHLSLNVDF
jgi:tetratricopeptide (TPR) repeat protein